MFTIAIVLDTRPLTEPRHSNSMTSRFDSYSSATAATLAVVEWHLLQMGSSKVRLLLRTTMTWPIMEINGTKREARALSKEMVVIIKVRLVNV